MTRVPERAAILILDAGFPIYVPVVHTGCSSVSHPPSTLAVGCMLKTLYVFENGNGTIELVWVGGTFSFSKGHGGEDSRLNCRPWAGQVALWEMGLQSPLLHRAAVRLNGALLAKQPDEQGELAITMTFIILSTGYQFYQFSGSHVDLYRLPTNTWFSKPQRVIMAPVILVLGRL